MDWRGIYGGGMEFGTIPLMRSWNPRSHLLWTMTRTMLFLTSCLPGNGEHEPLPLPLPHDTLMSSLPSLFARVLFCKSGTM